MRDVLRRLSDREVAQLLRELSRELFHRNAYRWRAPALAAEDLETEAVIRERNRVARALARAVKPAA